MNLWFRLMLFALAAPFRAPLPAAEGVSRVCMRVWPLDLDLSMHMNNGRYLTLMDLGRLDYVVRTGLWRAIARNRWTPIASSVTIRYRRELKLFQRFAIETRIVSFAEASVIIEQVFVIVSGRNAGTVAARALFKGGIYSRREKGFIDNARLMREMGVSATSPPPSPEVEAFLKADAALKLSLIHI